MKMTIAAAMSVVAVVWAVTAFAPAALTVYELFDYGDSATTFNGGTGGFGFDNAWNINGGSDTVVAGYEPTSMVNSAYTFMPVGGCGKNDHNGFRVKRRLTDGIDLALDGNYYFSFMMATYETNIFNHLEFDDYDTSTTILVGFRNDPTNQANNGKAVARAVCGTGTQGLSSKGYELSNAYFFVGKIEARQASSDYIRINVYEDGDVVPTNEPGTYQVNTAGMNLNVQIYELVLWHGGMTNDGRPIKLDELRFGTRWVDVVMPAVAVAPQAIDFGEILPGEAVTGMLAVVHNAPTVVSGAVTGISAPFSVLSGSPYGMAGGVTTDVAIVFAPTAEGAYTNNVTLTGTGCLNGAATLIGTALPEPVAAVMIVGLIVLAGRWGFRNGEWRIANSEWRVK